MTKFNYQQKLWGGSEIRLYPTFLAYLRLKYCLDSLKEVKGKVIDIGCGAGGFIKAVKHYRSDLKVYGVDISQAAINWAKKENQGVKFVSGDLYKLAFKNNYFDAVVMCDTLEHLKKPELALKEVNRILKKNGIFYSFTPLEGGLSAINYWLAKIGWNPKKELAGHIQQYSWLDLKKMFDDNGFKIVKKRFGVYLFEQLVDISYFIFLSLTGKRIKTGLEHHLKDRKLLKYLKDLIAVLCNLESWFFSFFLGTTLSAAKPQLSWGAGVHLKAKKQ
ncbi:class I SAM-dependent methyltransferase [Patescibacteria group bacterium]